MDFSMTIYMDFKRNYELSTIYIYNNLIKVITRTKIILYIMVYELKKLNWEGNRFSIRIVLRVWPTKKFIASSERAWKNKPIGRLIKD
jgi:hypothetical protein